MEKGKTEYSKNERAGKIVGFRMIDGIAFDQPAELDYRCPVCVNKPYSEAAGSFDERLEWSEYNGFLWCSVCNSDYPSALCCMDVNQATEIYLGCLEEATERAKQTQ